MKGRLNSLTKEGVNVFYEGKVKQSFTKEGVNMFYDKSDKVCVL